MKEAHTVPMTATAQIAITVTKLNTPCEYTHLESISNGGGTSEIFMI